MCKGNRPHNRTSNQSAPKPPCLGSFSDIQQGGSWDSSIWERCSNLPGVFVEMHNDVAKLEEYCASVLAYINRSGNEKLREYVDLPQAMGLVGSHDRVVVL